MSKHKNQTTALILPASPGEVSETTNVVKDYIFHWPLFVVTVLVAIAAAYFYLAVASPVYPITAALKFINPTSDENRPSNDGSLSQLDPIKNPVLVEDEINVIKSKKLIYQVVEKLQLWVNYELKDGLGTVNLYKRSPVIFNFTDTNINLNPTGEKLEIILKDANSFLIKDDSSQQKTYSFSTPVKSSFGTWLLKPTSHLKEYIGSAIKLQINDPDLLTDGYQKDIKASTETKEGAFLNLSMSDEVPARGRDILNSLIEMYRQNTGEQKFNQTEQALQFVNVRVDSLKRNLDSIETLVEQYAHRNGITDIAQDAERFRILKEGNILGLKDVNLQLANLQALEDYAKSATNTEKLPLGTGILDDASLGDLYRKISDLQVERQQKLAITPEGNPLFASIDQQINSLKEDFREKVHAKITTLKSTLLANKQQLTSFNSNVQSNLSKVPTLQKEYNALQRDRETKESLYKLLTAKREELSLQYASIRQEFEVVDDAHAGKIKWPLIPVVYALALILGLGLAAGILYLRKMLKEHISSRTQIEEETEVPVLGEISTNNGKESIVVSLKRRNFVIGEQFRMLRTNLYHLLDNDESGRVTLFTSSVSGEGKSFVSSNLAVTLAYASRKTIILEMDLRKPKVAAMFSLSNDQPGISDYLANENVSLETLIRPSGVPGLDVLGCGSILPNPSELIEKQRLDEMIADLRRSYDHIIIDSPPVHIVSDALIIARVADASLYVVRNNYTHKDELSFISELNKTKRFNKFSIVFNGVKTENLSYYYDYNSYNNDKGNFAREIKGLLKRF